MANQSAALSQFRVWNASSVATPKKSIKTVKLAPSLILSIITSSSLSILVTCAVKQRADHAIDPLDLVAHALEKFARVSGMADLR
jgi:hypothetical protein